MADKPITLVSLRLTIDLSWLGRRPVLTLFLDGREVTSTTLPKVNFWSTRREAIARAQDGAQALVLSFRESLVKAFPEALGEGTEGVEPNRHHTWRKNAS